MTNEQAFWLDGTPYCDACVDCDSPCLSEEEIELSMLGDGVGVCGHCQRPFPARRVWDQARSCWAEEPVTDGTEWAELHDRTVGKSPTE